VLSFVVVIVGCLATHYMVMPFAIIAMNVALMAHERRIRHTVTLLVVGYNIGQRGDDILGALYLRHYAFITPEQKMLFTWLLRRLHCYVNGGQ